MKKIYSFLTAALLTATAASAAVDLPYEAPVPTTAPQAPTGGIAANTWCQVTTSGPSWTLATPNNIKYPNQNGVDVYGITAAMSTVQTDSWLISPEFWVNEGTEYKVTFSLKYATNTTSIESLDVYLAGYFHDFSVSDVMGWYAEAYKSLNLAEQKQTYLEYSVTIKAKATENASFAFHAHGTQTGGYIGIANIKIEEVAGSEEPEQPVEPGDHVCIGKAVPYTSTIAVENPNLAFANGWKIIDKNNDNKTWEVQSGTECSTPSQLYARYYYSGSNPGDDYLISPAIHLEAGKDYVVEFGYQTKNFDEIVTLYASQSNIPTDIVAGTKLIEKNGKFTTFAMNQVSFTPTATGDYYFSFHCTSVKDKYHAFVSDFAVKEDVFAPAAVTNFTATADPNETVKVLLSWTLPTASASGKPFSDSQTVEKVEIYRDSVKTPIATLDGPVTTYEDTEENGLTVGRHTYSIVVTVAGVKSEKVSSNETGYVGPEPTMNVPFSSNIALSAGVFADWWKVINHNEDNKTWEAKTNTTAKSGLCAMYTYHSDNDADDYLISPAISMEAGKFYNINFGYWTGNDPEVMTLYAAQNNTVEAIKAGKQLIRMDGCFKTLQEKSAPFSPTTTGNYYFAFHVTSIKNKYYTYVSDFSVTEAPFAPAPVSDFKAIADPDGALKVTLSWILPTTTAYDTPLTADQPIESVEIYRDGSETALVTLPGTATSFEDTEETGLTSGRHSYTIVVTVAGAKSEVVSSGQTSYVALLPEEIPATFTPVSQTDLDDKYVIIKGEASQATGWSYYSYENTIRFVQGSSKQEDDMLIFPPLAIREAGYYRVTVSSKIQSTTAPYKLYYVYGTDATKAGMNVIGQAEGLTTSFAEHYFDFYAPEAGTYYVGLWSNNGPSYSAAQHQVQKVEVTRSSLIPAAVTELTAVPAADEELSITLSWINPTTSFTGGTITKDDYKVEIYLGETLYTTLEGDAIVDGTQTLDVTVDASGIYTVSVKTVGPEGDSVPKTPTVITTWVGPKVVNVPYSVTFNNYANDPTAYFWDVEDGNNDGKTWKLYTSGSIGYYTLSGASKDSNGLYQYDDFLFSPEMTLTAGQNYGVTYNMSGANAIKFYYTIGVVAADQDFNADHATWVAYESRSLSNSALTSAGSDYTYTFTVPADGNYKVVIAADELQGTEHTGQYIPRLYKFIVELPTPDVATELAVVPDPNYALEAVVSWINPANDAYGNEMSMGAITKAVIYRGTTTADLAEIGTITEIDNLNPGATSMFVDAEVPAPGSYTYKVEIYNEVGCAANSATVKSSWIGGGVEIPSTGGVGIGKDFENNVNFERGFSGNEWRTLSTNGNIPNFTLGTAQLGITLWSSTPDAWVMTRDLYQFEKNTLYEVAVRSHCGGGSTAEPTLKMLIGGSDVDTDDLGLASNKDKWEGSYTQIGEWSIPVTTTTATNAHKETFLVYFVNPASMISLMSEEAAQPTTPDTDPDVAAATKMAAGPARLAFNSQSKGDYYIDQVKMTVKRKFTTGVDEIEAAANGVVFDGTAINFDGKASVVVYNMTGALVLADKEAVDTVSLEHLATGAYIVSVVPENGKAVSFKIVK